jgi:DNA-binding NtrC family response regulator
VLGRPRDAVIRPSVLVVDDDSGMVETLQDILSTFRYEVTTACSAASAIRIVRQAHPDVVLMDLRMPGLNGVEALRAMKALAPQMVVIIMTAFTRDDLVDEARRAALAILPKPLDMKHVLALLEQATGGDPAGGRGAGRAT